VKNPFRPKTDASPHPKNDAGSGDLKDYKYDFIPNSARVVIQLAESDPHQDLLAQLGEGEVQVFVGRRTIEEERTDAPIAVRLFVDSRMTGVVGMVPRGLEPAVIEAVNRLESAGKSTRLPGVIVSTRNGLRVTILMGTLR
jgi:hypothetical protein